MTQVLPKSRICLGLIIAGVCLAPVLSPQLARAADMVGTFAFNRYISKLYVRTARMTYEANGRYSVLCDPSLCYSVGKQGPVTKLSIPVHTGKCPNQYHIKHIVTAKFKGSGTGWFNRTATIEGSSLEDKDYPLSFEIPGYYGNPAAGNLDLSVSSDCIYHGVSGGGGSRWEPWNW